MSRRFKKTLQDIVYKQASATLLTSPKITDINTFEKPGTIHVVDSNGIKKQGDNVTVTLPAKSIVLVTLK